MKSAAGYVTLFFPDDDIYSFRGLYTSIDSLPEWAKWITRVNPDSCFMEVMRMVVLKGSKLPDIKTIF